MRSARLKSVDRRIRAYERLLKDLDLPASVKEMIQIEIARLEIQLTKIRR